MAFRAPGTPILMFDLLMVAVLVVGSARAIRRLRRGMSGPIPDVPDAPPDAEPIATARYDDNGLATYSYAYRRPRLRRER